MLITFPRLRSKRTRNHTHKRTETESIEKRHPTPRDHAPFITLSNKVGSRPTDPPRIEFLTLRLKASMFLLKSSAASLFNGSDGFGSKNKYYSQTTFKVEELEVRRWRRWGWGLVSSLHEERLDKYCPPYRCWDDKSTMSPEYHGNILFECSELWEVDVGIRFRWQRRNGMNRLCTCLFCQYLS